MAFTYDVTTSRGRVRLNIGDTVQASAIFTDEEIDAFLSMSSGDVFYASAIALLGIASTKALLAKKKAAGNYSEDLTAIAKELREQAKAYTAMSTGEPYEVVGEQIFTDFNYNEIIKNAALRGDLE
jgi:hypothetical protein